MSAADHEEADRVEFVFVSVGGERYAVESGRVREVEPVGEPTRVPLTPEAVDGVVEVGGEVTAVVDGSVVFAGDDGAPLADPPPGLGGSVVEAEFGDTTGADQLVVFDRADGDPVALRVDRVEGVRSRPLSAVDRSATGEYVAAAVAETDEDGDPTGDSVPVVDVAAVAAIPE